MELFGYEITRGKKPQTKASTTSFVPPTDTDAAVEVANSQYIQYNFDAEYSTTKELINLYRRMAISSDVSIAIDEVVNEAIVFDTQEEVLSINFTDEKKYSDKIKQAISEEFKNIRSIFKANERLDDMFRQWFIDGRAYFHIIVDSKKVKDGIIDVREIDPRNIKKVREVKKEKNANGVDVVTGVEEYFVYVDPNKHSSNSAIKIAKEAIILSTSGLTDEKDKEIVSYLHQAIKPWNQLTSLEDSVVIYRISRAPERRVFYVDTGNLPKQKAEAYMAGLINRFKNKLVYDANAGTIKDNRHILSMMEDIWLPRREGSKGTEVSTLPGAQSLGDLEDVIYFTKKLYRALHVPYSRLDPQTGFSVGRAGEITREEVKFTKYIEKLRKQFSKIFRQALRQQLLLKNIITQDDWDEINENLQFVFNADSQFAELKKIELLTQRLDMLDRVDKYVGKYYSPEWVRKYVLNQSDDEQKAIDKDIEGMPDRFKEPAEGF